MTQIERISHYEDELNRLSAAVRSLDAALDTFSETAELASDLDAYMGSEEWWQDFEDDEAGRLPSDLRRGVLSEDALYDALSDYRSLIIKLLETAADALK